MTNLTNWWFVLALAAWAATQVADVLMTNAFLKRGVHEANGFMARLQAALGAFWWLPKAGIALVAAAIACATAYLGYPIMGAGELGILVGFYASVVLYQNYQMLRKTAP